MANSQHLVMGFGALAALAAGLRFVSRRRAHKNPSGLPAAELSDEERQRAAALLKASMENTSEAPAPEALS
jgi:hypothetical protein